MPTICCDNRACGYNDGYTCTCSHIRLTAQGNCSAFIPADELERREIELRCIPLDLEEPVLLLCRSNVEIVAQELRDYGFKWDREPLHGLFGFVAAQKSRAYVWVLQTSFDKLENILADLRGAGYTISDLISQDEKTAWEKEKRYSSISGKEREEILFHLHPPRLPITVTSGYWNGRLYGCPGKESVWVDGVQKKLTAKQAEEIRTYLKQKKLYDEQAGDLYRLM